MFATPAPWCCWRGPSADTCGLPRARQALSSDHRGSLWFRYRVSRAFIRFNRASGHVVHQIQTVGILTQLGLDAHPARLRFPFVTTLSPFRETRLGFLQCRMNKLLLSEHVGNRISYKEEVKTTNQSFRKLKKAHF